MDMSLARIDGRNSGQSASSSRMSTSSRSHTAQSTRSNRSHTSAQSTRSSKASTVRPQDSRASAGSSHKTSSTRSHSTSQPTLQFDTSSRSSSLGNSRMDIFRRRMMGIAAGSDGTYDGRGKPNIGYGNDGRLGWIWKPSDGSKGKDKSSYKGSSKSAEGSKRGHSGSSSTSSRPPITQKLLEG